MAEKNVKGLYRDFVQTSLGTRLSLPLDSVDPSLAQGLPHSPPFGWRGRSHGPYQLDATQPRPSNGGRPDIRRAVATYSEYPEKAGEVLNVGFHVIPSTSRNERMNVAATCGTIAVPLPRSAPMRQGTP